MAKRTLSPVADFSASSTPLGWFPRPQRLLNPTTYTEAPSITIETKPDEDQPIETTSKPSAELKEASDDPRASTTRRLLKYIARASGLDAEEVQRRATRKQRALIHVTGWMALALCATKDWIWKASFKHSVRNRFHQLPGLLRPIQARRRSTSARSEKNTVTAVINPKSWMTGIGDKMSTRKPLAVVRAESISATPVISERFSVHSNDRPVVGVPIQCVATCEWYSQYRYQVSMPSREPSERSILCQELIDPTTHSEAIPTGRSTMNAGRIRRVNRSNTAKETTSEMAVDLS